MTFRLSPTAAVSETSIISPRDELKTIFTTPCIIQIHNNGIPITMTSPKPSHNQPIADPIAHFKSIPWCSPLLTDKSVLGVVVPDRTSNPDTRSQLVNVTMNTPDTVRACVTFFRMPSKAERQGNVGETREKPFVEIACLLDVGDGLAGRPHVMHGGVFSVILDEVLSTVAYQHSGALDLRFQDRIC